MSDFNIFYLNFYINLKYCCHRSILQDLHFRGQKSIGNYKMLIFRIFIIIIEIFKIKTLVLCVAKINYLKFQNHCQNERKQKLDFKRAICLSHSPNKMKSLRISATFQCEMCMLWIGSWIEWLGSSTICFKWSDFVSSHSM